jgi:Ca2+-binding RTX toxin-like protein
MFANRSLRRVESLEKRLMLAADFEVVNSGNDFWVEARGTDIVFEDSPLGPRTGDIFTLEHISQNEVKITIDFPEDLDNNGFADGTNRDFIVGSFDLDFYEFQAAVAGKNFLGVKVLGYNGDDIIDAMKLRHHDDGQFELNGGDGDDTIIGGRRGDIINAGAGNDDIQRADNVDIIRGGSGIDSVIYGNHSGPAQDNDIPDDDVEYVEGTAGNDNINLSNNPDDVTIIGGAGNDTLTGGGGDDDISGGAGNDTINGNGGDDLLNGGAGNDTINGGLGNDDISGGADNDTLSGNEGDDTVNGNAGNDVVNGNAGNDTLRGGDGNDTLDGGLDDDNLNGNDGDDLLIGGAGGDVIRGGAGVDTSDYADGGAGVTVDLQVGVADGGDATGDSYPGFEAGTRAQADGNNDVENVDGTDSADTLRGDVDSNRLVGKGGDDNIIGRDGDDTLLGGDGNDLIGNDARALDREQYIAASVGVIDLTGLRGTVENGNDTIEGGAGNDTLRGGADVDTIYAGDGDDKVEGDGWWDTTTPAISPVSYIPSSGDSIYGGKGDDYLYASNRNNPNAGGASGVDFIDGEAGNDWIYGHAGEDQLFGDMDLADGGDDHLYGYDGEDELNGGNGIDELVGGNGKDYLFGGDTGNDTFWIEATGTGNSAELEDWIANAGAGPDLFNIYGIATNDTLGQLAIVNELDNDLFVPVVDIVSDFDSAIDQFDFKGLSGPTIVLKWS